MALSGAQVVRLFDLLCGGVSANVQHCVVVGLLLDTSVVVVALLGHFLNLICLFGEL
jgi:hypothetical protein